MDKYACVNPVMQYPYLTTSLPHYQFDYLKRLPLISRLTSHVNTKVVRLDGLSILLEDSWTSLLMYWLQVMMQMQVQVFVYTYMSMYVSGYGLTPTLTLTLTYPYPVSYTYSCTYLLAFNANAEALATISAASKEITSKTVRPGIQGAFISRVVHPKVNTKSTPTTYSRTREIFDFWLQNQVVVAVVVD